MVQILPRVKSTGEKLAGAVGDITQTLTGHFAKEHQEEEENKALERLTGRNLRGLSPEIKRVFAEKMNKSPDVERITNLLIGQGLDPKDAELYAYLTTGGQTEYIKKLLEAKQRSGGIFEQPVEPSKTLETGEERPFNFESEIDQIISEQDKGLTPAEKVARGKERYTTGQKARSEATTRLHGLSRDKERLGILESLNSSDKLPKDLSRLNVDGDGNLRLPFTATAESQRYVKTLNEFISGAKDSFGARVTNFDLATYLKQFPTLMNSKEGRKQLLQQMKIINDINSVYYKNLQKVYDKAGGARKIDSDIAESLAERMSEPQIEKISSKFGEIGTFSSLPNASEFPGRTMRDKDTGELFKSDGQNWIPQG